MGHGEDGASVEEENYGVELEGKVMGMDLTLVIDEYRGQFDNLLAYNRLRIKSNYDLFDQITDASPRRFYKIVQWYGDEGIEDIAEDPYGKLLTHLTAEELGELDEGTNPWNKAVMSMIRALPPDTIVVLYWH